MPPAGKAGKKEVAPPPDAGLSLGAFSAAPATAVIAPGSKQAVSVTFKAEGEQACVEQLGLNISDRCGLTGCSQSSNRLLLSVQHMQPVLLPSMLAAVLPDSQGLTAIRV